MADDVEDFGDFASAFPPNGATNGASCTQSTTSGVNQVNTTGKVDFFASLPALTSSTSGVADPSLDFASFTNHITGGAGLGEILDFSQFNAPNMNLAELKIPSPAHDSNVHMAGGVAFDIPPILDDDFSDPGSPTAVNNPVQLQHDLFSINTTLPVDENESSMDVHLSFPASLPPLGGPQEQDGKGNAGDDSFGDFESSVSLKTDTKPKDSTELLNAGSDLALFKDNSVSVSSVAGSNMKEVTKFGKLHSDAKSGGVTTSTTLVKTESSSFTNVGNSLDVGSFTRFESTTTRKVESKEEESNSELTPETSRTDNFASFANFQSPEATKTSQENSQFGDFGVFAGTGTTTVQEDNFGSFGEFRTQTSPNAAPLPTNTPDIKDDFGAFADSTGKTEDFGAFADDTAKNDEFGAFASTSNVDDFGAFGDGKQTSEQFGVFSDGRSMESEFGAFAGGESKGDEFGAFTGGNSEFGAFAESTSKDGEFGAFTSKGAEEFGAFAGSLSKDDEFGDFSSTTGDSKFGNFSSSVSVSIPRTSEDETKHKVCVPCG